MVRDDENVWEATGALWRVFNVIMWQQLAYSVPTSKLLLCCVGLRRVPKTQCCVHLTGGTCPQTAAA
jgi:hypothetical protein